MLDIANNPLQTIETAVPTTETERINDVPADTAPVPTDLAPSEVLPVSTDYPEAVVATDGLTEAVKLQVPEDDVVEHTEDPTPEHKTTTAVRATPPPTPTETAEPPVPEATEPVAEHT